MQRQMLMHLKFYLLAFTLLFEFMQYYIDSVKQMAHRQLVAGSPLRTLCLLIAGQPADVFSADGGGPPGAVHMSQQQAQVNMFTGSVSSDIGC